LTNGSSRTDNKSTVTFLNLAILLVRDDRAFAVLSRLRTTDDSDEGTAPSAAAADNLGDAACCCCCYK